MLLVIKADRLIHKIILIWKKLPIKFLPYAEFYKDKRNLFMHPPKSMSNVLSAGNKNMTKRKKNT